ncbi:MAG TPA: hypothetical protein PK954_14620 [Anaerolineales bacterium]|nr:hypothetical protein [Anaerolineales bacterium]HRF49418.1 hypothetical protein [Anaerolineales bacterium]
MRIVGSLLAAVVGLLGLVFLIGAQGQVLRFAAGVVLLAAAGAIVYFMLLRPQVQQIQQTVVQKIDLSGDVNLERMTCQACNAPLSKDAISLKEGAIMVTCPSCGTTYQIEEKPKY